MHGVTMKFKNRKQFLLIPLVRNFSDDQLKDDGVGGPGSTRVVHRNITQNSSLRISWGGYTWEIQT